MLQVLSFYGFGVSFVELCSAKLYFAEYLLFLRYCQTAFLVGVIAFLERRFEGRGGFGFIWVGREACLRRPPFGSGV